MFNSCPALEYEKLEFIAGRQALEQLNMFMEKRNKRRDKEGNERGWFDCKIRNSGE